MQCKLRLSIGAIEGIKVEMFTDNVLIWAKASSKIQQQRDLKTILLKF